MHKNNPRLIRTFLVDGTPEGIRIIDCETMINAIVIPRLKLGEAKDLDRVSRPALYFLINSDGDQAYIGEAENFYNRLKNHDQNEDWWDVLVAIVSATNQLDNAGVKYLESLAVERAQNGSIRVENYTTLIRNNISCFEVHKLENILDDTQLVLTLLNYDILTSVKQDTTDDLWYLKHKGVLAREEYHGSQFVLLEGSTVHNGTTDAWARKFPKINALRQIAFDEKTTINGDVDIVNEKIAFKSVSMAAGFVTNGNVNGWNAWKNNQGKSMDEIIRKSE